VVVYAELVSALTALGTLLSDLNRASEAEPLLTEALAISRTNTPPNVFRIAAAARALAEFLTGQGRYAHAEPLLIEAYRLNQGARSRLTDEAFNRLERQDIDPIITLYQRWGQSEQAAVWRARRLDLDFPADPFAR